MDDISSGLEILGKDIQIVAYMIFLLNLSKNIFKFLLKDNKVPVQNSKLMNPLQVIFTEYI